MYFCHSQDIWRDFPELVAGVIMSTGIRQNVSAAGRIDHFIAIAQTRLATSSEGQLPEIQAWRRTFSTTGLKPTQYRCASESLLRRLRIEHSLPRIHPLIDLCNAISAAFAIPVAVFDVSKIAGYLQVGYASGTETYLAFSGEVEHPNTHEVIFADAAGRAHARRWTNRQGAYSAVCDDTESVLIVAEAMHETAAADIAELVTAAAEAIDDVWSVTANIGIVNEASPRFDF
jgi:DNA/RNA-binding domain of Phe-tRNA-synthetase-like protein